MAYRRISIMPAAVFAVFGGLSASGIYFAVSGVLEVLSVGERLYLAPPPYLSLSVGIVNVVMSVSVFKAVRWFRPLVAAKPLLTYPLEYGLTISPLLSLQSAEVVATIAFPIACIYCLYFSYGGKQWYAKAHPYEP